MASVMISGNPDAIRQNYEIIQEDIDQVLSDPRELFTTAPLSDSLGLLQNKVDAVRIGYELDYETQNDIRELQDSINTTVLTAFGKEFPMLVDAIDTNFSGVSVTPITEFIYGQLYLLRKAHFMTFMLDFVLSNRANLAKRYKTPDSKKDIGYQKVRAEVTVRNPEYYLLILNSNELCDDILGDENTDISEIMTRIDLTEDQEEVAYSLFEHNGTEAFQQLAKSLLTSPYYDEFKSTFKVNLLNGIKKLS